MKAYAETEIELHSILTRTLDVSGQLHVPTSYPGEGMSCAYLT
jgi:hypothetical protein